MVGSSMRGGYGSGTGENGGMSQLLELEERKMESIVLWYYDQVEAVVMYV